MLRLTLLVRKIDSRRVPGTYVVRYLHFISSHQEALKLLRHFECLFLRVLRVYTRTHFGTVWRRFNAHGISAIYDSIKLVRLELCKYRYMRRSTGSVTCLDPRGQT